MSTHPKNTRTANLPRKVFPKDGRIRSKETRPSTTELFTLTAGDTLVSPKRHKFRSDFELSLARKLAEAQVSFTYEDTRIPYQPTIRKYTPDFYFPLYDFYVEAKGHFSSVDRKKHLLIQKQNPDKDIRFVFMRASNKLNKNSKTTYSMWAEKHGFMWAEGSVPKEWFDD